MSCIYKADDAAGNNIEMWPLTKACDNFDEKGELLACVYAPEIRDSQGDIASADVIKDMMYRAAKEGHNIDMRHDERALAKEKCYIAESFIVQKSDPRFTGFKNYQGETVDVTGAWAVVIKVDDPELRKLYREGKWNGVSMGGHAELKAEKSVDVDSFIKELVAKVRGQGPTSKEIDMTGDELKNALAANNTELVKALGAGLGPILKEAIHGKPADDAGKGTGTPTPTNKAADAPVYKGDGSAKSFKEHAFAVRRHNIISGTDWANPASVTKSETELVALEKEVADFTKGDGSPNDDKGEPSAADKAIGITKSDTPRERELKRELAKERKKSGQGAGSGTVEKDDAAPTDADIERCGLSKEDAELFERGRKATAAAQKKD